MGVVGDLGTYNTPYHHRALRWQTYKQHMMLYKYLFYRQCGGKLE